MYYTIRASLLADGPVTTACVCKEGGGSNWAGLQGLHECAGPQVVSITVPATGNYHCYIYYT